HESPRLRHDFVTRKITDGVARVKSGLQKKVLFGNMDAIRDWGHAMDYIEGMWLMLQQEIPDDYVLATGKTASVRDALEYVCSLADLDIDDVYEVNPDFMRPADVPFLCGDSSKASRVLGWTPKHDWKSLLREMYYHDLDLVSKEVYTYK
ncbi:MAG: GDP-mannose 4,6-dehydratase, partial [Nitrospinae bacterium]|nr:GDP-mannose 4,6-dehydratase [Nitrospinota bacterium]